ncbi:MAG: LacI family DNA-binding transcriptional regulator [Oceanipulchritudo sp.]
MKGIPTTREIAARVGCSHVTVSRALKNSPLVKEDLRDRIWAVAKELGYRPNPLVASLMTNRAMKRRKENLTCTLGWLNTHPNPKFWQTWPYRRIYLEGARERAEELGYAIDVIWGVEPGMTGKRLEDILISRGIYGLILPSPLEAVGGMGMNWDPFAVVCIGQKAPDQLPWHRVTLAIRDSMQLCIERLLGMGYTRIGLAIPDRISSYGTIPIESIFSYYVRLMPEKFVSEELLYHRYKGPYEEELKNWLGAHEPDVIICMDIEVLKVCRDMGLHVPEDVGLAHLHLAQDVKGWAGVDPYEKRQAAAAVDLVTSHLQRNERGVPPYAKMVQIFGDWRDGWTCRASGE